MFCGLNPQGFKVRPCRWDSGTERRCRKVRLRLKAGKCVPHRKLNPRSAAIFMEICTTKSNKRVSFEISLILSYVYTSSNTHTSPTTKASRYKSQYNTKTVNFQAISRIKFIFNILFIKKNCHLNKPRAIIRYLHAKVNIFTSTLGCI